VADGIAETVRGGDEAFEALFGSTEGSLLLIVAIVRDSGIAEIHRETFWRIYRARDVPSGAIFALGRGDRDHALSTI